MPRVDVPVRSPTGSAWMLSLLGAILAGEVYSELHKDAPATFFGMPFLDSELWPVVALGLVVFVAGIGWLVSLYVAPGAVCVDADAGRLERRLRPIGRLRTVIGTADAWRVRVLYFSEADQRRHAFKRIEILGPDDFKEVLLPGDVGDVPALLSGLDALGPKLGELRIDIERPAKAEDPAS